MSIAYQIAKAFLYKGVYKKGRLEVKNKELIQELPNENVLVVMNHTTYYMEAVAFMFHLWKEEGNTKTLSNKFNPVVEFNSLKKKGANPWREFVNGVARKMGMIYVRRQNDKKVNGDGRKQYNDTAFDEIYSTLDKGWVLFFPQGTTKKNAPLKPGILKIIQKKNPTIILIKTSNFAEVYGKKGVFPQKESKEQLGIELKRIIKDPMSLAQNDLLKLISEELDIPVTF